MNDRKPSRINWCIGIPQAAWLFLVGIDLGISLAKDGEPVGYNHSFALSFVSWAIMFVLLACGGFFTKRGGNSLALKDSGNG